MSFIAKNPLIMPKIKNTPSVPDGTRGFIAKEDGWYDVGLDNKETKIATIEDVGTASIPDVIDATQINSDKVSTKFLTSDNDRLYIDGLFVDIRAFDGDLSLSTGYGSKINLNSDGCELEFNKYKLSVKNDGVYVDDKKIATADDIGGGGLTTLSFEVFNAHKTDGVYDVIKNGVHCVGIIRTQSSQDLIYRYLWDTNSIKVCTTLISTGEISEEYTNHFRAAYDTMGNTIHETYATKEEISSLAAPVKSSVTILGGFENWKIEDVLDESGAIIGIRYGQVVNVNNANITPYSKVDLQLTSEQTAILYGRGLAFVAENDNGVVTVYCIGAVPEDDYTFQAVVTEVVINA